MANYPDLEGRRILVTGATRGIGHSIACSLAKNKAHVVFNFRKDPEQAKELEKQFEDLGGKATGIEFDVNDFEKMKDSVNAFAKEHGNLQGLVNNAGVSKDQLAIRLKPDDIDNILGTNLKAAMVLTSHLSRGFLREENVSVVNISSVIGLVGNPGQAAYAASKAGLLGFTKSFAKEMAQKNIRCNAVCPGLIATDMTKALDEKTIEGYISHIPLKRFGEGSEVADLTCFLLSQASAYITGETIKVDGGLYI